MKPNTALLGLVLLLLAAALVTACGTPAEPEATPTAAEQTDVGPTAPPPDPAFARDAALAYLVEVYGDGVAFPDLEWHEETTTPKDLVGASSFEYTAGDWMSTVSFPIVAPQHTIYKVTFVNEGSGFRWEGEVDAWGNVTKVSSSLGGTTPEPDSARARDAALAYVARAYGDRAATLGLDWQKENLTPEDLAGSATVQFSSADWVVIVSYPIVLPEDTYYDVTITNEATGFYWEGEVDPWLVVTETTGPGGAASDVAVEVEAADLQALAEGNSAFALDLYQVLKARDGNLFYSPYSVSLALAMTYAGARGETEQQMAEALHFLLDQERLHPAFNALDTELASRGEGAASRDGEGFQLHVANALWGQEGKSFLPAFLGLLEANYGAGLRSIDFASAPEKARQIINGWVSDQTEGRIEDLIPRGMISAVTRLVLTNAIYFNAAWAEPFEEELTADGPFYLLDGNEVSVPLMVQSSSFPYAEGDGYQAVALPYDGHELSMIILLPEAGEFEDFESSLDAELLGAIQSDLDRRQVSVTLPRFEFDSEFSLNQALVELGMVDAFGEAADFSGMTGERDLFISAVVHKAFVGVDEAGTEAAAATAVVMVEGARAEELVMFTANHPFLFLIVDKGTSTILFLGRVVDPSG